MSGVQKGIKIAAIVLAIFIICIIINAILSLIGFLGFSNGDNEFTQSYEDISSIEIDLTSANVEIKEGSEFRVEATNVSDNFKVRERNGNLYIEEDNFWFWNNSGGEVIIYVPQELNQLDIDTGAGSTIISSITASRLNVDQGVGKIEINDASFANSEIDGGTGTITVANSIFSNMELDSGVGEIEFTGQILGRSSIDSGIGEINLNLTGGEELYTLTIDKGLGDLKINNNSYSSTTYGSGTNRIDIDGGVGEININFL